MDYSSQSYGAGMECGMAGSVGRDEVKEGCGWDYFCWRSIILLPLPGRGGGG